MVVVPQHVSVVGGKEDQGVVELPAIPLAKRVQKPAESALSKAAQQWNHVIADAEAKREKK